jgi:hypothetical protein
MQQPKLKEIRTNDQPWHCNRLLLDLDQSWTDQNRREATTANHASMCLAKWKSEGVLRQGASVRLQSPLEIFSFTGQFQMITSQIWSQDGAKRSVPPMMFQIEGLSWFLLRSVKDENGLTAARQMIRGNLDTNQPELHWYPLNFNGTWTKINSTDPIEEFANSLKGIGGYGPEIQAALLDCVHRKMSNRLPAAKSQPPDGFGWFFLQNPSQGHCSRVWNFCAPPQGLRDWEPKQKRWKKKDGWCPPVRRC